ncbi:MAG: hypothetical protein ACOY94_23880 [Bacillota bacterium]
MGGSVRRLASALMILALVLTLPGGAAANGGPPQVGGDMAGVVLPARSSTVHVLKEWLRFQVSDDFEEAQVTARYQLENRGEAVTLPVVFVVQDFGHRREVPVITWNGEPRSVLPLSTTSLDPAQQELMRKAWGGESEVVDPVSGERYVLEDYRGQPVGDEDGRLSFYRFELVLGAGEGGMLEVTYTQQAGYDRARYVHRVYHYQYLLLPARGWASFGGLEIEVEAAPARRAYFASSLPLTWSDGAYRASLPGLPEQNLLFSFMSRARILGSMVHPGPYYWIAAALLMPLAYFSGRGMGWLAARIRSRGWARTVAVLTTLSVGLVGNFILMLLIFSLFPWLIIIGYAATPFIGVTQWFISVLVTLVAALRAVSRYHPRRRAQENHLPSAD